MNTDTQETAHCADKQLRKPRYEVDRKDNGYELKIFMPGVPKNEVSVVVEGEKVVVAGHRAGEIESWKPLRAELSGEDYRLELKLKKSAIDASGIKAVMEDGVLLLELPKKAEEEAVEILVN